MPLKIYLSQVSDGNMKPDNMDEQLSVLDNRAKFLLKNNISPNDTSLVKISYDGDNYTRYLILGDEKKGDGIVRESDTIADALVTTATNHALLLPLADCVGAAIYDETKNVLMLSHLGRHSLEKFGGVKSVEYLVKNFNVNPDNLLVWLSPAAGRENYPLSSFEDKSLQQVAKEQLASAGIRTSSVSASSIDTTKNDSYFSHSQFLSGKRKESGRFAVVAIIEE